MCFSREKQSNSAAKNVPLRRAAKAALLSALPAAGLLFRKRTGLIQGSSCIFFWHCRHIRPPSGIVSVTSAGMIHFPQAAYQKPLTPF